jgi:RNA-directed DNA polymerase
VESRPEVKPFDISKRLIYAAWEKVRANKGAPGVDAVSISLFEKQWRDNLYKLWNRMSSGSYFPGRCGAWRYQRRRGG